MSTSGHIHEEFLCLLFFIANKLTTSFKNLATCRTRWSSATVGEFSSTSKFTNRTLGMVCDQAVARRGAPTIARRRAAAPRDLPPFNKAYDEYDNEDLRINGVA
jgi:hypothetical protein